MNMAVDLQTGVDLHISYLLREHDEEPSYFRALGKIAELATHPAGEIAPFFKGGQPLDGFRMPQKDREASPY